VIQMPSTRFQRTITIVAIVLVATGLCWLSWRVGSPLMTEIRTAEANLKSHGLRYLAPRGGPVQRVGMP
jgi:hypothetical protein